MEMTRDRVCYGGREILMTTLVSHVRDSDDIRKRIHELTVLKVDYWCSDWLSAGEWDFVRCGRRANLGESEETSMEDHSRPQESIALQSIVKNIPRFFDSIWQKSTGLFEANVSSSAALDASGSWNEELIRKDPLGSITRSGLEVVLDLLERASSSTSSTVAANSAGDAASEHYEEPPLLFKDLSLLQPDRCSDYNGNLFAAFLDGCSVVLNHANVRSPYIAALCQDLQKSFPHVYANCYLTPAACQTVPAHADDRDVFVIQVYGEKEWLVYKKIPVPYPYTNEQVGKVDSCTDTFLEVPDAVMNGPVLFQARLQPGQVLYMPRGYVHQARAVPEACSFHITVALATHDWTLAGQMSSATAQIWKSVIDYRMAMHRDFGCVEWGEISPSKKEALQQQIDDAILMFREHVTAEAVHESMKRTYENHNQRAALCYARLFESAKAPVNSVVSTKAVGREAASLVSLTTWIRASTEQEKNELSQKDRTSSQRRGLFVREDNYDYIMNLLQLLRSNQVAKYQVQQLRNLMDQRPASVCDLTLISFVRRCVEFGALAVVIDEETNSKAS